MKRRHLVLALISGFILSGCSFQIPNFLKFWENKTEKTSEKEEKQDQEITPQENPDPTEP